MTKPANVDPLTPAQRKAWELHDRGWSQRRIAIYLGITREAVRDRLDRAARKLEAERKDAA